MVTTLDTLARSIGGWIAAAILLASLPCAATALPIERVVGRSGIEAWLVRDPTVAVVTLNFTFRGGTSQDPADKAGVANMVARLLTEGAGDLDAQTFHERLQAKAVELYFSADRDRIGGSLRTLMENQSEAAELLRLALAAPRFDSADLERIRAETRAVLRHESVDPDAIASRRWWETAFVDHPYGRALRGTFESISLITADDLTAYARNVLARDTLRIAIVGNIDAAGASALIDRAFGALPARSRLIQVAAAIPQNLGRHIAVDVDVDQSIVLFGGEGIMRNDPDFMAALVVNQILGANSPSSRLFGEVRVKRGLAYSVRSTLVPLKQSACLLILTATRPERVAQTIEIVETEIRRLDDSGPTDRELTEAKSSLKGSFMLGFDTSLEIADQLVAIQFEELGMDYINDYSARLSAVNMIDVKRVTKRLLGGPLLVTVAGRSRVMVPTSPR
jgi:zinc protease